jgi:hypothetical protein
MLIPDEIDAHNILRMKPPITIAVKNSVEIKI